MEYHVTDVGDECQACDHSGQYGVGFWGIWGVLDSGWRGDCHLPISISISKLVSLSTSLQATQETNMSHMFTANVKRAFRYSPAAFLRQCRADACAGSHRHPATTVSPQRAYASAGRDRSLVCAERTSSSFVKPSRNSHARHFSASASTCATTVLQNPRVDEDGIEMTIEISDRAAKVPNSQARPTSV
jgi:hypothetical protein